MSWVQAAAELQSQGEGEVFDEEADEMRLLQNDWKKSMEKRLKGGYLDGVEAGKQNSLQTGFNLGYKLGVTLLMPCGELRGTLSALITWCNIHDSGPSACTQLGDLLTSVVQCEDNIVKSLSSIHQISHPSDLSSTLEDMNFTSKESIEGSCNARQDCCLHKEPLPTTLLGCRTTPQLSNIIKHELGGILRDTIAVAQQNNLSADLLSYLRTLESKFSLF
ncbi:protein YAE1 homolog isoform X3 [Bufo gargarizans]|uniref:protein YAE1 homolog isoform X3 n=2 Tax=Bufo gargarizans TaxID=30331 RepID=UPI001CF424AD|nr:protein YAE1 homolog isoform X3 [Bufo gargarizans]